MLYIAKKEDDRFYVNPEDAKKYAQQGYEIINEDTKHKLNNEEIDKLKAVTIEEENIWQI